MKCGSQKKLIMGVTHSIRPNKDYMSYETLTWANSHGNVNEVLCTALEFYYQSLHRKTIKDDVYIEPSPESEQFVEDDYKEDKCNEEDASSVLNTLIASVKRK